MEGKGCLQRESGAPLSRPVSMFILFAAVFLYLHFVVLSFSRTKQSPRRLFRRMMMSARACSRDTVVRKLSPRSSSQSFKEMIGDEANNVDNSEEDPSSRRSTSFRDACSSLWPVDGPLGRSGRRRDICRASSWARRSASLRQDDHRCRSRSVSLRTLTADGSGRTVAAVPDARASADVARRC